MKSLTRVAFALTAIVLLAGGTGWAASIAVNTFEPAVAADGFCSLIEAMENANADAAIHFDCMAGEGPDAIELMVGEYIVREVHNEAFGPSGLPAVTGDLAINGNTAVLERARNGPQFRLLHVTEGARLILNNVTIANGAVEGWRGGGLFNAGGTVVLNHCTVRGNEARDGGGLANQNGTMLLTWTVVDDNRSDRDGGGIDNWAATGDASLVLLNSTVSSNTADKDGGGLVNTASAGRTARLQVVASTVSANRAERSGGGISQFGSGASQMEPKGGTITRPRWGGAQMELRIVNGSHILGNDAGEHGGGVASWVSPPGFWASQVEISQSDITGNTALDGDGGGVYGWFAGSSVAVTRSTVDGNEASAGRGGGLAIGEGAVLELGRSTVSHNLADGMEYPDGVGGGIEIIAADATILNSTISGNQALRGAGIDVAADASDNRKLHGESGELGARVEVDDCTIVDNTAQALGGGIAVVAVPGFGPAELRMVGTILGYNADRRGSGNCSSVSPAVLISDGHNVADDTTCWLMSAPDGGVGGPLARRDFVVPDLMLEELRDNGGPTLTHMPLDGSPVIDVGAGGGQRCHGDQRDRPRDVDMGVLTSGCTCDAGAVEAGSEAMPIVRGRDSSGGGN